MYFIFLIDKFELNQKEEQLLRNIIAAFYSEGRIADWIDNLEKSVDEARWHIDEFDRCQYQSENLIRCGKKYVREVNGLKCCEQHALVRERS